MKIGELALATGTPVETIRHYEREGLLAQAARTAANYRIYGPAQVQRLGFIRHCRALDMTLDEVRALLRISDAPAADCGEAGALLEAHIGHVAARIVELKQLQVQLKALRRQCAGATDAAHCGILKGLSQPAPPRVAGHAKHKAAHVRGAHARTLA